MKNIAANEKIPCVINDTESTYFFLLIEILGGNPNFNFSIKRELSPLIEGVGISKNSQEFKYFFLSKRR